MRRFVAVVLAAGLLAGCSPAGTPASPRSGRSRADGFPSADGTPGASASGTATPSGAATLPATIRRRAVRSIARRTGNLGAGGVSIAAVDLRRDLTFRYGATHGMRCGSIAKLYILETLLLQHDRSGTPLSGDTDALATRMIENSDNDAANALYVDIGEGRGLRHAAGALHVRHTRPGPGILWGFSLTSAVDFVALLRDLVTGSALRPASRRYALGLLAHVEDDQRWGVGTAADSGTTFYNKNGWLPASPDGGRWLVNSVGIVRVHGDRVLMAVLTQHGSSFAGGIDLVDHLSRTVARALTTR